MKPARYRLRNNLHRAWVRVKHPWPFWVRQGGVAAVVTRADGSTEDLGTIADTWAKRWGVESK